MDIVEEHPWEAPDSKPAVLLVDARGVPARCERHARVGILLRVNVPF